MTEQAIREIAAALQRGELSESERLSRLWLQRTPDDENFSFLLALSLQHQHRHAEALEQYANLVRLFPDSATHQANYATALRQVGRHDEAVQAARAAVRLAPDDASHYVTLGLALSDLGDIDSAQNAMQKAYSLEPDAPLTRIHIAALMAAVRDAETHVILRPWRSWLPLDDGDLQLLLATTLTTIGDANSAHVVLTDLVARMPQFLQARLQLAGISERMNDLDRAEAILNEIGVRHPVLEENARLEIVHQRATLAQRKGDNAQARAMLESAGPRNALDSSHFFSLAAILDKQGDTSGAMQALATAHARQVQELKVLTPLRFAPDAPVLPSAVGRLSAQDYAAWPELNAPSMQDSPIVVVGFPRSGTTLLEQMLDAHPALQSMDEHPFMTILGSELGDLGLELPRDLYRLNQRDCDELRKRYLTMVCEKIPRNWQTRLVDKVPLNMLWLPLIKRLFPRAKIILCLRHPCDVVLSNYMQNYRSSVLASACSTLERTALAYVAAFESWLYHVELLQPDVMISRYEDLVTDLPKQTERIARFLELDDATPLQQFDRHAREKGFIATPSYTEVIKPVSRKAVNRWRRYRAEFEPVLPILAPMLQHWSYDAGDA